MNEGRPGGRSQHRQRQHLFVVKYLRQVGIADLRQWWIHRQYEANRHRQVGDANLHRLKPTGQAGEEAAKGNAKRHGREDP